MFDLEKAIREWKKSLFKSPGLEEAHIIELEEGLRDEIEDLVGLGQSEETAFHQAVSEVAPADVLGDEFYKVRTQRLSGRPPWRPPRFMPALLWHYLKIAMRKIKYQKSVTVINVIGLSVGMACFLLILTYIQFELSFDRFHQRSSRLFRVALHSESPDEDGYTLSTPEILSTTIKENIPEVEQAVFIQRSSNAAFIVEGEIFFEDGLFVADNFLNIFDFKINSGAPSDVLSAPNAVLLSENMAEKLFGAEDPVGKTIQYQGRLISCDLNIVGIMQQPPQNSHLQFDYLISAATLAADQAVGPWFNNWDVYVFHTYVALNHKSSKDDVAKKISELIQSARSQDAEEEDLVYLQPLKDIHLRSNVAGNTATNNRIQTVYLLGIIAFIILMIACINSMNLSTARAATRKREIGLRKVIGAKRTQLIKQFIGESYLFTVLAMLFSLLLFHTFFPLFSSFLGNVLKLSEIDLVPLVFSVGGTILFVGAFSGIYPAFILSAFPPHALSQIETGTWLKGSRIRNVLVIFQFSAVIVLLIGTIVVTKQLNFIKKSDIGYKREHVLIVPFKGEDLIQQAAVIKNRLLDYHKVLGVSVSDSTPLSIGSSIGGMEVEKENGEKIKIDAYMANVDPDFLSVFDIKIAAGRNFSREFSGDAQSVLVNEALVRKLGWQDPLRNQFKEAPVIGVIKDFHFDTLHKAIEPAVFYLSEDFFRNVNIGIRVRPEDPAETLAAIKGIFTSVSPTLPFDFYFLDDAYNQLYRKEQRLAVMIGYLEGLSIILGCMGLFGLATYAAQRRSKEIGIRKVMGASISSIIRLMSREFLVLVIVSNVIAWPLGYYFLEKWLQGYAYRCSFGIEIFFLAGIGTLLIALLAVGLHTIKAAWASPLDSIRYE